MLKNPMYYLVTRRPLTHQLVNPSRLERHLYSPSVPFSVLHSIKYYDFPAVLTAFIHSSSPRLSNPCLTISYTCLSLSAPKSLPSMAVRYATPARTRTASPSKTITSHSLVALSKLRDSVKRDVKTSLR